MAIRKKKKAAPEVDAPAPVEEPTPEFGDPDGRKPAGQDGPFNEDDYELVIGEDATKPEGKREQAIYVEKKGK